MRRTLITLALLVATVAALALVGPSLIDWSVQRDRIAAELTRLLDRPVEIAGPLDLAMLPRPHVIAHDVRIGAAAPAGDGATASVEEVQATLSLGRLLLGHVEAEEVLLRRPVLMLDPAADTGTLVTPAAALPSWLTLRTAHIEDGRLVWADPVTGVSVALEAIDGSLALSRSGVASLRGTATLAGTPLSFDATLQPPSTLGDIAVTARLDVAGAVDLTVGGTIQADGGFVGQLEASGRDLAAALAAIGRPAPAALARGFALSASLRSGAGHIELGRLAADMGAIRLEGLLGFATDGSGAVDATLTFSRIGLDTAGQGGPAATLADALATALANWPLAGPARLDLVMPVIDVGDGRVRDLRLRGTFEDGTLTLDDFAALLPGGTTLTAQGRVVAPTAAAEHGPDFALELRVASDDLRGFLAWAGLPLTEVASNRLRHAEASFSFSGHAEGFTLSGVRLTLDGAAYRGGMAYVAAGPSRARPGLGIRLDADRLDLDGFRLAGSASWLARWQKDAAFRNAVTRLLTGVDANLDLRFGTLLLDGQNWADVGIDATIAEGSAIIRAAGASLDGTRVDLAGSVEDLVAPSGLALDVAIESGDPAAVLAILGGRAVPRLSALGTTRVAGRLAGAPDALDVALTIAALDGTLDVEGTIDLARLDRPTALSLHLVHPDLPRLLGALDPAADLPVGLGAADIRCVLDVDAAGWRFEDVDALLGTMRLTGEAALLLDRERPFLDLSLDATTIDIAALLPQSWTLSGLPSIGPFPNLRIDPSILRRVDGRLRLAAGAVDWGDWRLDSAQLSAVLSEGRLVVDRLVAAVDGGTLGLSGELDATGTPAVRASLDLLDADLATLLPRLIGTGGLDGRIDFGFAGAATGQSLAELAATIAGDGRLAIRDATARGFDLSAVAPLLDAPGQPLAFLQALRDAFAGGESRFTTIQATLGASAGRFDTHDLRLTAEEATGTGRFWVDLARWQMRLQADFSFYGHGEQPPVGLVLEGPPEAPVRRLDAQPLLNWVARRAAEASGMLPTPDPAEEP